MDTVLKLWVVVVFSQHMAGWCVRSYVTVSAERNIRCVKVHKAAYLFSVARKLCYSSAIVRVSGCKVNFKMSI